MANALNIQNLENLAILISCLKPSLYRIAVMEIFVMKLLKTIIEVQVFKCVATVQRCNLHNVHTTYMHTNIWGVYVMCVDCHLQTPLATEAPFYRVVEASNLFTIITIS